MRPAGVRAYVDSALDLLQRHSIESSKADWGVLRAEAHVAAADARGPEDAYDAIRHVIASLGNPHTHLIAAQRAASPLRFGVPTGRLVDATGRLVEVTGRSGGATGCLVGATGWLILPQTHSRHGHAYVTAGLKALRRLIAHRPTGWVVDLRGNHGGDMHPMLTVVAPLLGNGERGRFITPHGETSWGIRSGHVYNGRKTAFRHRRVPAARDQPVAVLVDKGTASSGEAVLVSFLGAPNTRTFGRPTAGYATANQTFSLSDGAKLAITTALMADRTGRTYGNTPIAPQTLVGRDNGSDKGRGNGSDDALGAAIEWLASQP